MNAKAESRLQNLPQRGAEAARAEQLVRFSRLGGRAGGRTVPGPDIWIQGFSHMKVCVDRIVLVRYCL